MESSEPDPGQGITEEAAILRASASDPMPVPGEEPPGQRNESGCGPRILGIAILIIAALAGAVFFLDESGRFDPADDTGPAAGPTPTAPTATAPATEGTEPPETAGGAPAPPDPESLPPGDELYQGQSGGPIGHIAQDGQSRFLSLERRGVGVGDGEMTRMRSTWQKDGEVLSFGVRLNTRRNAGRYGINLFRNGTEYSAGCSIEVGQTGCDFPGNDARLTKGEQLVIIIGEQGHIKEKGKFSLNWWFVFRPD